MEVDLRDTHPLVETGEKPQGADGHDTQVFNVDDRQFYFKWYNDRWPDFGKFNQFITEIYAKDGAETEVTQAFDLFENKIDTTANRFYGWCHSRPQRNGTAPSGTYYLEMLQPEAVNGGTHAE